MRVEVSDYRKCKGRTLQGFLSVRFPSIGLQIADIAVHEGNGKGRWLQLPAKPFVRNDGSKGWNYIFKFYEKNYYRSFQESTLKALDAYQLKTRGGDESGNRT